LEVNLSHLYLCVISYE